nr:unnamed protein product [Callosobruchus chinensis]
MSRIASPTSPTTLSPATACVVEYFQLHCLSNVRSVIYYLSVVAGDAIQISQHKEWGSVASFSELRTVAATLPHSFVL